MPIDWKYAVLLILTAALVTLCIRAVPFLLFGRERKMPDAVAYLGNILPAAMMATLVVYCLRSIHLTQFPSGIAELISVAVVAGLHLWRRNTLLSIAGGTICYMILVQNVFIV